MATLFEEIIEGKRPADKVYENEHLIAIKDINPAAPVHLLIILRKPIPDLQSLKDYELMGEVAKAAQHLAKEFGIEEGYRLITNNGSPAGQSIFHLHFHLLGGRGMGRLG